MTNTPGDRGRGLSVAAFLWCAMAGAAGVAPGATPEVVAADPLPGIHARTAALLVSGQAGGEIDGALVWALSGITEDGRTARVGFVVEIHGRDLLAGVPDAPVGVEIAAYLIDESGGLVDHSGAEVGLNTAAIRAQVLVGGLRVVGAATAARSRSTLRVAVRNKVSGRYSLLVRDVDLRPDAVGEVRLLPPLVTEPQERWVTVLVPGAGPTTEPAAGPWPSARPVWRSDQNLEIELGGPDLRPSGGLVARMEDSSGRRVLEPEVRLGEPTRREPGLTFSRATVAAPDLPSGPYRLVVSVLDGTGAVASEEWLDVVAIDEGDEVTTWMDASDALGRSSEPRAAAPVATTRVDRDPEPMRAEYRRALQAWADEDVVEARRIVVDLERPVAAAAEDRGWRQLVSAEASVLSDLASEHPAVVLAAVLLHRELYAWYLARGEGALARHSWESAAALAIEAEDLDGFDPPEGFSAAVLLDLAGQLVISGQAESAHQVLEAALALDRDSEPVLLALGALEERSGRPGDAVEPLERLVRLSPEHREARLRLGVCRAREGDLRTAEELLRGILESATTPWIRSVAFQETARLLVTQERFREAVDLLVAAVAESPSDPGLQVLLAHVLDRQLEPRRAAAVLTEGEPETFGDAETPRFRYCRWPEIDGRWLRSELAAGESLARAAVREALP